MLKIEKLTLRININLHINYFTMNNTFDSEYYNEINDIDIKSLIKKYVNKKMEHIIVNLMIFSIIYIFLMMFLSLFGFSDTNFNETSIIKNSLSYSLIHRMIICIIITRYYYIPDQLSLYSIYFESNILLGLFTLINTIYILSINPSIHNICIDIILTLLFFNVIQKKMILLKDVVQTGDIYGTIIKKNIKAFCNITLMYNLVILFIIVKFII
jgi:hypothetical protein